MEDSVPAQKRVLIRLGEQNTQVVSTFEKGPNRLFNAQSEGKFNQNSQLTQLSSRSVAQLLKYRMFKGFEAPSQLLGEECLCRFSTASNRSCPCETHNGLCVQSLKWIGLLYQPKEAGKLASLYENYSRNTKHDLTALKYEISRDSEKILSTWGFTKKSEELIQVLLNFAKHCIYYRRSTYSKMYGWLAAALLYHCEPYQAFWLLDSLTEELDLPTKLPENVDYTYRLVCAYFREKVQSMVASSLIQEAIGVDVRSVIEFLLQDLLCSYMPLDVLGYSLECMLVRGWRHLQQLVLSYLDKRFEVIEKNSPADRELTYIALLNNDTQWPLIFFNMESFKKMELSTGSHCTTVASMQV